MRQAVILVGGKGTRLGALASAAPKPMMLIDGDKRFLDYLIENFARHGVEEILLVAGHLGDVVEAAYHGTTHGGCRVEVVREPEPAGTGGALRYVADRLDPQFFLSNGDSYFDFNYLALASVLAPGDVGALSLRWVDDARRYGSVDVIDGRVTNFREKDEAHHGGAFISGGVYALRREVLDLIQTLPCSIEADVFPRLAREGRLAAKAFDGYFIDIGLPETLNQGRRELPASVRRPAVFFDRDDTLNVDAGYTHRPEDLRWTPGAVAAIRAVNDAGWLAIVVTNQAGVARGLYEETAIHAFHANMQAQLAAEGAHLDALYYCPHHPDAQVAAYRHDNHPDRKPNPGLILKALRDLPIDRGRSVMIGDRQSDLDAGLAAGISAVQYTGGDLLELVQTVLTGSAKPFTHR